MQTSQTIQLPEALLKLPRVNLALLPTPLYKLDKLTALLNGPTIYIKRDDMTGLAGGGNKTRKLEFIIADALKQNADCLVTAGGIQSNHCRQTAAQPLVMDWTVILFLVPNPHLYMRVIILLIIF